MSWDPALLRKYNSTNHFKLLNQVRSDLKEQPIQRSIPAPRQDTRQERQERLQDNRPEQRLEQRSEQRQESRQDAVPSRRGGRGEGGGRRRSAPAPVPLITSTPANSFDPIVTVPVLTDVFTDH